MNAVETIQAAIVRLEELKWEVDPGPLVRWRDQEHIPGWDGFIVIGDSAEEGDDCNPVARVYTEELADMLITLHRTIDAQLAILTTALSGRNNYTVAPEHAWSDERDQTFAAAHAEELALANAILGGAE